MKTNSILTKLIILIIVLIGLYFIGKYVVFTNDSSTNTEGAAINEENTVPSDQGAVENSPTQENASGATSNTEVPEQTAALSDSAYKKVDITAPNGVIHALVADTQEKMELGLSFRESLAAGTGMIFEFDTAGSYEFWMKDMKFPLDIVWLDANRKVVGVNANLQPDSYPETFPSPQNVLTVIEIPAGAAAKLGIKTGTVLKF